MTDNKAIELKNKVEDYRRFAFILIALSGFLMLGMVLPNEAVQLNYEGWFMGMIMLLLSSAVILHAVSIKTEKKIHEQDDR